MRIDLALFLAPIIDWDHSITLWLNRFAGDHAAVDRIVSNLSDSAMLKGGLFMAFLWWQWFQRDARTPERRQTILTALACAILAIGVARALQTLLPYRERPLHNEALNLVTPVGIHPGTLDGWSSFPSDHAVLFFALATAVWRLHRPLGVLAFLWSALVICLPRIYLGYHYASDILAGAAIGIAIMRLAFALPRAALLTQPLLRWEARHATSFYCLAFLATLELAVMFRDVRHLASDGVAVVQLLTGTTAIATEAR